MTAVVRLALTAAVVGMELLVEAALIAGVAALVALVAALVAVIRLIVIWLTALVRRAAKIDLAAIGCAGGTDCS